MCSLEFITRFLEVELSSITLITILVSQVYQIVLRLILNDNMRLEIFHK